jgi:hypothetical protein
MRDMAWAQTYKIHDRLIVTNSSLAIDQKLADR